MQDKARKEEAHVVCKCMNITDKEIEQAVLDGARTFYELQERTKISTVCGQCKDEADTLLHHYIKTHFAKE